MAFPPPKAHQVFILTKTITNTAHGVFSSKLRQHKPKCLVQMGKKNRPADVNSVGVVRYDYPAVLLHWPILLVTTQGFQDTL